MPFIFIYNLVRRMKCPFCNEEMEHGFASSARSIVWKPKEKLDFFDRHIVAAPDEERLSWGITSGAQLEGYRFDTPTNLLVGFFGRYRS